MALDHVRDLFHLDAQHYDPADLTQTKPIPFFTRWITHFCAPTFMFLAGTGAYLRYRRGKSASMVAHFLWTRGLWLVVLELTWVRWFGWRMNFGSDQVLLWVIWALGVSILRSGTAPRVRATKNVVVKAGRRADAGFVVLRWSNLYGDMSPWSRQSTPLLTLASFLRYTKYPPSLLYPLMTLGPGIFVLGLLERVRLSDANPSIVFGRVPLFFYLVWI